MTTLAPAQAIEYLETKELQTTWDWTEQLTINNANVFVVAKAAKMSILQDIRNEVLNAIENGETLRGFQKRLEPTLRAKGWWGKVLDENTGKTIQLGSPHRLKTIYQTNLQSSYAAGRWTRQEDGKAERPYLMYDAVMDMSTRPAHAALNGIVKRVDDPFWRTHYPPNGYLCRCTAVALTPEEAGEAKREHKQPRNIPDPDKGFNSNPGLKRWKPLKSNYDEDIWRTAND